VIGKEGVYKIYIDEGAKNENQSFTENSGATQEDNMMI
jgi:hypothetical protein